MTSPPPATGLGIGPYELLERVGVGGMGEVWRARHRTLGRLVAVKLIRAGTLGVSADDDRVALGRFEREARVAASLRSPHAIQVQDFGVTPEGTFFQVMELLDGLDLQALVERFGAQPPGRVVGLLRHAADALTEAHQLGFVHRDVKPSNLFLCRLGTRGDFLKVLDFGLARPAASDVHVTRTGGIPGSAATTAPELLRSDPPTDKADVYALGCVATWLLAGRLPFAATTAIEMVVAHLEKAPAPLDPGVPAPLAELVARCLTKDPAARPTSRELSRLLAATGLEAVWSEEQAEAWWEENQPGRAPTVVVGEGPAPSREQVYTRLRREFEESRIDLGEYERRLDVARRAQTPVAVLDALRGLPDLPQPTALVKVANPDLPAPRPGSTRRLVTVLASTRRAGAWQPDASTRLVTVFGGAELDLRAAVLGPGMTELRCVTVFGSVEITVPPGLYVELNGVGVLGSFDGESGAAQPPTAGPWVRVSGVAVMGSVDVVVKPLPVPGRSFGEVAVAALTRARDAVLGKPEE